MYNHMEQIGELTMTWQRVQRSKSRALASSSRRVQMTQPFKPLGGITTNTYIVMDIYDQQGDPNNIFGKD